MAKRKTVKRKKKKIRRKKIKTLKPKQKRKTIVKRKKSAEKSTLKSDLAKYDIDKLLKQSGISIKKIKTKRKINYKPLFTGLVIAVVLLLAVLLFLSAPKNCKTDECFIKAANECEPAVLEKKISTADIRLQISEECVLNKKIKAMAESELQDVKDLFIGAEMNCKYDKGKFDEAYVTQISGNLENCDGNLVEAIKSVI